MTPTQRKNSEKTTAVCLKLQEIAELVQGEIVGDKDITITGCAGLREAQEGDISFLSNPKYLPFLKRTRASAVVTSREIASGATSLIRTADPSLAFTKIVSLFTPLMDSRPEPGVHATAVLGSHVTLGRDVSVGAHAVIEDDVVIGDRSVIGAQVFIGRGSVLGADLRLFPRVTIYENTRIGSRVTMHAGAVIGAAGFGYQMLDGMHQRMPHTGFVLIEDDVDVGANACIDRGRFDKTWIKKGTKIDNLVQIGHNVVIDENCLVVAQSGIAGSARLGRNVVVAGQAGLAGHIEIGDDVVIGARAGVTKSFEKGTVLLGEPARPMAEQKKIFAVIARLPEFFKEFAEFKKRAGNK